MNMIRTALVSAAFLLLQFYSAASAGTLDQYYLEQFGESSPLRLQKAVLLASPDALEPAARCGMPLKHALKRDWSLLEESTRKVLAKQLASPVLAGEAVLVSAGSHFKIHYATTGSDAPPPADTNSNGIPDWVETVAATFEYVYSAYGTLGYQTAPTTSNAPYDIYLRDLAPEGYYGLTNSGSKTPATYPNSYTSWMELDNNYTDPIYKPALYTALQSLQITAAHEYHHAVQYGYTIYFDIWYAEATATWMEDELYPDVNQLYTYVSPWFTKSTLSLDTAASTTSGGGYGRWIFNRYLSEKHTPSMILNVWKEVGTRSSPGGGADIPMVPVLEYVLSTSYGTTLGDDFLGFARRVYIRDWTDQVSELAKIPLYSAVSAYTSYPVNSGSSPKPYISLPQYAFAYYRFTPALFSSSPLTITVAKSAGIRTAVFTANTGEVPVNSGGNSYTVANFSNAGEVVLLVVNITNTTGQNANFSTDGTTTAVTDPTVTPVSVITPTDTTGSGGGSSNGCFIATAAYGSYLHPQVQALREFRDRYLLTNAPGRVFVSLYYRFSPPAADFISRHPLLRSAARLFLTPLVAAVMHPAVSAAGLLMAACVLYRQVRRRLQKRGGDVTPASIRSGLQLP